MSPSHVGEWVRTPEDEAITSRAVAAAEELGWNEGKYEEWYAFVSGFRVGFKSRQDEPRAERRAGPRDEGLMP